MPPTTASARTAVAPTRRTVLGAALALGACTQQPQAQANPLAMASAKARWQVHPGNPIVAAGALRDKAIWNDPCVLRLEDGSYVMYLTSSVKEPFKPPILPFRALSRDGISWRLDPAEPVLDTTGTPYVTIETPSVVRHNGKWHMYFMGVMPPGSVPASHVGHAVSEDGIRWRMGSQRLIAASGKVEDWNGFLVSEPGAVVFRNRVYLYFHALGARPGLKPPQLSTIGLAISEDGERFGAARRVLAQDEQVFPPSRGWAGYATVSGLVHQNRMHLFYGVVANPKLSGSDIAQAALHHAVSDDGETNWRHDPQPIFTREDFDWTEGGIIGPTALVEGGRLRLWFAGHMPPLSFVRLAWGGWKGRQFGIGYAEAPVEQVLGR